MQEGGRAGQHVDFDAAGHAQTGQQVGVVDRVVVQLAADGAVATGRAGVDHVAGTTVAGSSRLDGDGGEILIQPNVFEYVVATV